MTILSIMPTYNCASIVGLGVRCALEQDVKHHLVVIDDSTDGTTDLLRDLLAGQEATLIHIDRHVVIPRKRDIGASLCDSDFIAQWDCDNYYPPCRLREQREAIGAPGRLAVCHIPYTRWARPFREDAVWRLRHNGHPLQMNVGGTFFYTRALRKAVGGHDTDRHPGEDMAFGHKCAEAATESVPAPAAFAEGFLGFEWGGNVFPDRLKEPTFVRTYERWQDCVPSWVRSYFDDGE